MEHPTNYQPCITESLVLSAHRLELNFVRLRRENGPHHRSSPPNPSAIAPFIPPSPPPQIETSKRCHLRRFLSSCIVSLLPSFLTSYELYAFTNLSSLSRRRPGNWRAGSTTCSRPSRRHSVASSQLRISALPLKRRLYVILSLSLSLTVMVLSLRR